jgi:hypothetical protein
VDILFDNWDDDSKREGDTILGVCREPKIRDDSGRELDISRGSGSSREDLRESPTSENLRLLLAMAFVDVAGSGKRREYPSWDP